jgi:hypothetical protein
MNWEFIDGPDCWAIGRLGKAAGFPAARAKFVLIMSRGSNGVIGGYACLGGGGVLEGNHKVVIFVVGGYA